MPALEAFGRKWRVGSDDFVFPYASSILVRFLWFISIGYALVVYDRDYDCDDERLLKIYLCVLVTIHFSLSLVELSILLISARGTIANPAPRRKLYIALYIQVAFFVVEYAWDVVGVLWAFDPSMDCPTSHTILILVRGILIWNLITSSLVGIYLIVRIGFCQLCCRTPPRRLRYEELGHSVSYGGRTLSEISSGGLVQHRRHRHWQWRLEWLLHWMRLDQRQQSVFSDVSATLADAFTHFRGYVPSDVLAGITLLAMEHHQMESTNWDEEEDFHVRKELDFHNEPVCQHFNRTVHYMKFAAASYGCTHCMALPCLLVTCKCKLQCCTGQRPGDEGERRPMAVVGDSCGWQTKSLVRVAGVEGRDIIYATFTSEVFCPAFYVAYDHKEKSVVIVIRGTLSIKDALTDLSAEPGILSTADEVDTYGHRGMIQAAHALQLKLETEGILETAFGEFEDYRLVLVGHSLGAGVAAILAILLKPQYPKLHCFAYSPPGQVISMQAVPKSRSYITSLIVGNDFIPRITLESFDVFCRRIIQSLQTCQLPKYRIFLDGILSYFRVCRPVLKLRSKRKSVSQLTIENEPLLSTNYEANFEEEDIYDVIEDVVRVKSVDPVTGKVKQKPRTRVPLFLPGRIIHITRGPMVKRCCGLFKHRPLTAYWTAQSEFSELVLEKNMLLHHTSDHVLDTLMKLQKQLRLSTRS